MIRLLTLLFTLLLVRVGSTLPSDCSDHEKRIDLLEEKVHKLESIVGKLLSTISVDKKIETEHHHVRREVLSPGLEGLEGLEGLLNKLSEDGSLKSLKGKDGKDGVNGEQGQQGPPGRDGLPGIQGQSGVQVPPGPPGSPGAPGNCSMVCQRQDPTPYKTLYSQQNISSYLRASNIPAMKELTACFYYEPNEHSQIDAALKDKTQIQWLISIRSAASDNDFGVGLWYGTLGGYRYPTDPSFSSHLDSFLKPHRHCFVWSSGSYLKWFYDMHAPGQLELVGQIKDTNHPRNARVLDGNILVLLNDQDTHGGGLEAGQMAAGNIADFQMWNRAFSDDEVRALGCSERGNIVTFHEMETVGPATFQQGENFRCTI